MIIGEGVHYLYRYVRLDTNRPFYIGMGSKSSPIHASFEYAYKRAVDLIKRSKDFLEVIRTVPYRLDIILESDDREFIIKKEIEFIALYGRRITNTGILVNITQGGDGGDTGKKSEEAIRNLIERSRNRIVTERTREKLRAASTGKRYSSEVTKKALETKKKRGYVHSREGIVKRCTPVIQYNLDMTVAKEWDCINDASEYFGMHSSSNIVHACSTRCKDGTYRKVRGFIWRYKDENNSRKMRINYQRKKKIELEKSTEPPEISFEL